MHADVSFTGVGARLHGTVTCPDGMPPVPGVVLIGGSGPADRRNDGLFDVLRDHLVQAGIAVLAYDKRGVGQSTGAWSSATVDALAGDAAAAVACLKAQPLVAEDAVGVLGHSEGGWVALRLGVQLPTLRHVIANSCPAVSFVDAEVFALTRVGAGERVAATLYRQLSSAARAGAEVAQGRRIFASYEQQPWYPAALGNFTLDADTWTQLRVWVEYDPYPDLIRMTTPTLAILGESDFLVPVAASVAVYQQTAARAARPQQIAVMPGADHRLRTAAGEFAAGYLQLLSNWCADRAN
ncbi:MAG: alpha/beta hydrolase [Jatrophihabitans sp.]